MFPSGPCWCWKAHDHGREHCAAGSRRRGPLWAGGWHGQQTEELKECWAGLECSQCASQSEYYPAIQYVCHLWVVILCSLQFLCCVALLHCALPCPALPCPALPCPALPCSALLHRVMSCLVVCCFCLLVCPALYLTLTSNTAGGQSSGCIGRWLQTWCGEHDWNAQVNLLTRSCKSLFHTYWQAVKFVVLKLPASQSTCTCRTYCIV